MPLRSAGCPVHAARAAAWPSASRPRRTVAGSGEDFSGRRAGADVSFVLPSAYAFHLAPDGRRHAGLQHEGEGAPDGGAEAVVRRERRGEEARKGEEGRGGRGGLFAGAGRRAGALYRASPTDPGGGRAVLSSVRPRAWRIHAAVAKGERASTSPPGPRVIQWRGRNALGSFSVPVHRDSGPGFVGACSGWRSAPNGRRALGGKSDAIERGEGRRRGGQWRRTRRASSSSAIHVAHGAAAGTGGLRRRALEWVASSS